MKIKIEGGNKLFADAMSYIEANKKIIKTAEFILENFNKEPKETSKSYWWSFDKDKNKLSVRLFDEKGNLNEVAIDYDKIYDTKNDPMFEGLKEKSEIDRQKKTKFSNELGEKYYTWSNGSELANLGNKIIDGEKIALPKSTN